MSKKLAAGADAIVLDVKAGSGAFMPTVEAAEDLARLMVEIGADAGRQTVALISDMNQPLGHAVGNALEVREALDTLRGGGPDDFWQHCLTVAATMVRLAGWRRRPTRRAPSSSAARADGRGLAKFRELVVAQGGDGRQVDDPSRLPQARYVEPLEANGSGYRGGDGHRRVGLGVRALRRRPAGQVRPRRSGRRFPADGEDRRPGGAGTGHR
jgi:pyrimidine-nucleoside phosphorylase